jgi:hypothetical protein
MNAERVKSRVGTKFPPKASRVNNDIQRLERFEINGRKPSSFEVAVGRGVLRTDTDQMRAPARVRWDKRRGTAVAFQSPNDSSERKS